MQSLLQNFLCAGVVAGLVGGNMRGDVVYTTNPGAIGGSTNAIGNVLPANTDTNGYIIGTFGTGTVPVFNFTATGHQDNKPVVRFNTAGSAGDRWQLNGLNSVFYIDDMKSASPSKLLSGTVTWQLFAGTSSTAQATFTQALNQMDWLASTYTPNVYQNNPWTLESGINELNGTTDYTLLLSGISNLSLSAAASGDELHWTYYSAAPTGGQAFTLNSAGYVVNSAGAYVGTSTTNLQGLAFDINASNVTLVPESGTLTLGAIAVLGGIGCWWFCHREAKKQVRGNKGEQYKV